MTVGDCKIKTLALLDENDLTIAPYTSDADIAAKLPLFITMGQRVIAQQQKIVKTAVFTEPYSAESVSEGVADPLDAAQVGIVLAEQVHDQHTGPGERAAATPIKGKAVDHRPASVPVV